MLTIGTDILPRTFLSYLAFRVSFQNTLERILLARQIDDFDWDGYGYLTEVPFLTAVPPQVQLDLLARTWSKHIGPERARADLVDESVVYAVCETAARLVELEPPMIDRYLTGGPMAVRVPADKLLSDELRSLHLNLPNDGDFLLISQFEDMCPDEAREIKQQFRIDEAVFEPMFEALSRWHVSPDFLGNLKGLLALEEIAKVAAILQLTKSKA
jgi:hypothetical protein